MRKILCCGDRDWTDWHTIREELLVYASQEILVVHGDCRGADRMCAFVAKEYGCQVDPNPANWDLYGKAAGAIRNRAMLKKHSDIERVLAFHDHLELSKGTKDMVAVATAAGIPVKVVKRTR